VFQNSKELEQSFNVQLERLREQIETVNVEIESFKTTGFLSRLNVN
jgi:hypothetical protein